MKNKTTDRVLKYIEQSPTAFHAVDNLTTVLESAGFVRLKEKETWMLQPEGRYYVTRNHSSILSFVLPSEKLSAFRLIASHSDSPCFKLKPNPEIDITGICTKLL